MKYSHTEMCVGFFLFLKYYVGQEPDTNRFHNTLNKIIMANGIWLDTKGNKTYFGMKLSSKNDNLLITEYYLKITRDSYYEEQKRIQNSVVVPFGEMEYWAPDEYKQIQDLQEEINKINNVLLLLVDII